MKSEKVTKDGRKYRMAMILILVILAAFALCIMNPVLASVFGEVVGGLVGIYIVYCGGNIGSKIALGKYQGATIETEEQRNQLNNKRG